MEGQVGGDLTKGAGQNSQQCWLCWACKSTRASKAPRGDPPTATRRRAPPAPVQRVSKEFAPRSIQPAMPLLRLLPILALGALTAGCADNDSDVTFEELVGDVESDFDADPIDCGQTRRIECDAQLDPSRSMLRRRRRQLHPRQTHLRASRRRLRVAVGRIRPRRLLHRHHRRQHRRRFSRSQHPRLLPLRLRLDHHRHPARRRVPAAAVDRMHRHRPVVDSPTASGPRAARRRCC